MAHIKGERKAELNPGEIYMLNEEIMTETAGKVLGALCVLEKRYSDEAAEQRRRIEELTARLEEVEASEKRLLGRMKNIRDNAAASAYYQPHRFKIS